jgi:hypothetical protein
LKSLLTSRTHVIITWRDVKETNDDGMGEAHYSFVGPPRTHERVRMVWLHHRLIPRSPSGTLGMELAIQVTMRVIVTIPLTVTPRLAFGSEPLPLSITLTGTLLWSGTLVMGLIMLSEQWKGSDNSSDRWMTLHTCKRRCQLPSTRRPAWCTTSSITSGLTLMLKSYKNLSLWEVSGAQVWVIDYLVSFLVFSVILSLISLTVPLLSAWVLVWIASISKVNWVNKRISIWHG